MRIDWCFITFLIVVFCLFFAMGASATEVKSIEAAASLSGASIPVYADLYSATSTIEVSLILAGEIESTTETTNNIIVTGAVIFNASASRRLTQYNE